MTLPFSCLTRRQTLALPLIAVAALALAQGPEPDFATRLVEMLARLPSGSTPADLTLQVFEAVAQDCSVVIRLDWLAGMRQRRFWAGGVESEAAFWHFRLK